jgi:Fe-S-cluster containining protein
MSEQEKDRAFGLEDKLRFRCAPGVPCFNECCQDVTIFLGPYDVMRLRRELGLSAQDFLGKHTTVLTKEGQLIPLVNLKMREEDKRCPFVTEEGCSVYRSRPWACRMFPLDVSPDGKGFGLLIGDDRCKGLKEPAEQPVRDYLNDQGTPKYQVMDDLLGELINDERFKQLDIENEQVKGMVSMSLYDLDSFRKFVFASSFLQKFDVDARRIKRMEKDDEELLRFAFDWLHFGLLGKQVLKVREEVAKERAGAVEGGEQ